LVWLKVKFIKQGRKKERKKERKATREYYYYILIQRMNKAQD
jgi:hypothetical protein